MKNSYKTAALAALLPVVSITLSEIKGMSISVLSPSYYQDYLAYKSAIEEQIRIKTDLHRKKVFETICSDGFRRKYGSSAKPCVIICD